MTHSNTENPNDRRLWQRSGQAAGPDPSPPPDPLDLAAYLDGQTDQAQQDRTESYLADHAEARQEWAEVRDLLARPAKAAPAVVMKRAKSLVAGRRPVRRRDGARIERCVMVDNRRHNAAQLPICVGQAVKHGPR